MKTIWVLVADGRRARLFFTQSPRGELNEFESVTQPQTGQQGRDYWSDAPGRTFDSHGQGRHAMEMTTNHKELAKQKFARRLGKRLESAYHAGEFDKLVLVSEPAFLGHLRRHLHNDVQQAVTVEVDKDLTLLPADKIRAQLPDRLASALDS